MNVNDVKWLNGQDCPTLKRDIIISDDLKQKVKYSYQNTMESEEITRRTSPKHQEIQQDVVFRTSLW